MLFQQLFILFSMLRKSEWRRCKLIARKVIRDDLMYSLPTPMMVLLLPIPFDLTSSFLSPVQWHYQFSGTLLLLTRLTPLGYRNAIIIIIILVVVVILIPKMTMRMMVIILSDIIIIIIAQDTLLWSLSIYFSSCVCQRSYWEHLPHYFFMINDKNIPPFLPSSTSYFFCWWSCSLIDTIRLSFLYFFLLLLLLIYASKRRRHRNIIVFFGMHVVVIVEVSVVAVGYYYYYSLSFPYYYCYYSYWCWVDRFPYLSDIFSFSAFY